ncbi:unnamed protein product [Alopecurus aequalis]
MLQDLVRDRSLVKLLAGAFYEDLGFNGSDLTADCDENRGILVVILDHLTRYQWVKERDLAKSLGFNRAQLSRILHFLEEEKLLKRKELKSAIAQSAGRTAAAGGDLDRASGEGSLSYCCLDYPQICDVTSYKLLKMKENLKTQLDARKATPQYLCYNCNRSYEVFDAMQLQKHEDDNFHCESCNTELVADIEGERWDGSRIGRKIRSVKYVEKLKIMKEQWKPLMTQLDLIKNLPVPDFGYLQEGVATNNVPGLSINTGQFTSRLLLGETMVEAPLLTFNEKYEDGSDWSKTLPKSLIRKGMIRPQEAHITDNAIGKDHGMNEGERTFQFQREYIKAYYEAVKTKELENGAIERDSGLPLACEEHVARKVGIKSKHRDDGVMCEEELLSDLQKEGHDEQRLQPPEVPSSVVKPTHRCRRVSSWLVGD